MEEFAIYLGGSPGGDPDARAAALAQAGFTVVDWKATELEVLARYGVKGMIHQPTVELARQLAGHPALWGYHCGDEPYPEDKFPALAGQLRALAEADPGHPAFLNMLSTAGEFLRTYMKVVQPPILSFDYYQWWWGSDRYFEKLEQFREAALGAGVPLGNCLEVNANPHIESRDRTRLPDNAAKLRQSVYTNLAYGVKMIEWFNCGGFFEPETLLPTPAGRDVIRLNEELRILGPVLIGLQSVDVFHTPPLPRGTRESPREYWVQLIGEELRTGLVQGMFEDEHGVDYLLVVNRDYRAAQSVVVRLQSKWLGIAPWQEPKKYAYGIERFDRQTGEWKLVSSSSFVGFTLVIAPADGELFRIATRVG